MLLSIIEWIVIIYGAAFLMVLLTPGPYDNIAKAEEWAKRQDWLNQKERFTDRVDN